MQDYGLVSPQLQSALTPTLSPRRGSRLCRITGLSLRSYRAPSPRPSPPGEGVGRARIAAFSFGISVPLCSTQIPKHRKLFSSAGMWVPAPPSALSRPGLSAVSKRGFRACRPSIRIRLLRANGSSRNTEPSPGKITS